jgi:hypothetical protein
MATEDDAGESVAMLGELRPEPSPAFFGRVRSSIERRVLGKHVLEMSLLSLGLVAFEYIDILMNAVADREGSGGPHE